MQYQILAFDGAPDFSQSQQFAITFFKRRKGKIQSEKINHAKANMHCSSLICAVTDFWPIRS
jgi:hypothetical protein